MNAPLRRCLALALPLVGAPVAAQAVTFQPTAVPGGPAGPPVETSWKDMSPSWLAQTSPIEITIKPGNPDWIVLTTALRGVMYSGNGGQTWSNQYLDFYINDYTPSWWVTDVAFNPQATNEAIASTLAGTYWSTDSGQHWYVFTNGDPGAALEMEVSPDGNKVAVAGVFGSLWVHDWAAGTWAPPVGVVSSAPLTGLSFDVGIPSWLYIANSGTTMWTTPDYGTTLHKYNRGLPPTTAVVLCDPVIAGRTHAVSGPELYLTLDGPTGANGGDWELTGAGLPGTQIMCLIHHPLQPDVMFMGLVDHGVYVSGDRGASWRSLGTRGMSHLTIIDVAVSVDDPRYLYACGHAGSQTSGGFYRLRIGP